MSDRLRLFVALDLPQEVRRALAGWATHVAPDGVRAVRAENLHLTLAFLGSRSQQEADTVAALLPGLARPLGTLSTAGALWLSPRRPKVLTVVADGRPDSLASGSEWRTAALWGIGLVKTVNRHTRFLHDGRARSIEETILWHGGEGAAAMERFRKLSRRERDDLLAFLRSL